MLSYPKIVIKLLVIINIIRGGGGIPISGFFGYPFNGYQTINQLDTSRAAPIPTPNVFNYFGTAYNLTSIVTHGHIFFLNGTTSEFSSFTPRNFPFTDLRYSAMIAPFWNDINTGATNGGTIHYKAVFNEIEDDTEILKNISEYISMNSNVTEFNCVWGLIVTWDHVIATSGNLNEFNTFQVVIATDGHNSVAIFIYADDGINWSIESGNYAVCGYNIGDGINFFSLPGSGTEEIINIDSITGNTGNPGQWIFLLNEYRFILNLVYVTSTSAFIAWEPPSNSTSHVVGYTVIYIGVRTPATVKSSFYSEQNVTVAISEVKLTGLVPNSTYEVTVRVLTINGAGPFSVQLSLTTDEYYDTGFIRTLKNGLSQYPSGSLCACIQGIFTSLEDQSYGSRDGPLTINVLEEPGVPVENIIQAVFGMNGTFTSLIIANVMNMSYDCSFNVLSINTFESDVNVTLFSQINMNRYLDMPKLPSLELKGQMVLDGVVFETLVKMTGFNMLFTSTMDETNSMTSISLVHFLNNAFNTDVPFTPLSNQMTVDNLTLQGIVDENQLYVYIQGDIVIGDWCTSDVLTGIHRSESTNTSVFILTSFNSTPSSIPLARFLENSSGPDIASASFFNTLPLKDYHITYVSGNFNTWRNTVNKLQLPTTVLTEAFTLDGWRVVFTVNISRSGLPLHAPTWTMAFNESVITFTPLSDVDDAVGVVNWILTISRNDTLQSHNPVLFSSIQSNPTKGMVLNVEANTLNLVLDILSVELRLADRVVTQEIELTIPMNLDDTPNLEAPVISDGF